MWSTNGLRNGMLMILGIGFTFVVMGTFYGSTALFTLLTEDGTFNDQVFSVQSIDKELVAEEDGVVKREWNGTMYEIPLQWFMGVCKE